MTVRDPLEYVLNRMENAGHSDDPAKNGYGAARRELLDRIVALRVAFDVYRIAHERLPYGVVSQVWRKNDQEGLTREQIADWLEEQGY